MRHPGFPYILIRTLSNLFYLYGFILFARVFSSWVGADPYNPVVKFLYRVTEPVVKPIRRMLPPVRMGNVGLDFSVMVAALIVFFLGELVKVVLVRLFY